MGITNTKRNLGGGVKQFCVHLPVDLHCMVKELARKRNVSMSQIFVEYLEFLKSQQEESHEKATAYHCRSS